MPYLYSPRSREVPKKHEELQIDQQNLKTLTQSIIKIYQMNISRIKTAAYLWSAGSVLFFMTIVLYVFIHQPAVESDAERTAQLIESWAFVSAIWRLETLAVVMVIISSWYFATILKSMSWFLVTLAHIVMIVMYANMLGAYPAAAESFAEGSLPVPYGL
jgi:hypothetical protein